MSVFLLSDSISDELSLGLAGHCCGGHNSATV